jgi:hypothetical protein
MGVATWLEIADESAPTEKQNPPLWRVFVI